MLGCSHRTPDNAIMVAAAAPRSRHQQGPVPTREQTHPRCADVTGLVDEGAWPASESPDDGVLQIPGGLWDYANCTSCVHQSLSRAAYSEFFEGHVPHSPPDVDMQLRHTDHCERASSPSIDPWRSISVEGQDAMSWSTAVTNNTPGFASMSNLPTSEGDSCSRGPKPGERRQSLYQQQNDAFRDARWDQKSKDHSQSSKDTSARSRTHQIKSTALEPPEVLRANSAAADVSEGPTPLWTYSYMDGLGATDTCLGYQPEESLEETPQKNAGWWPDYFNAEQSRTLSDTCLQTIPFESRSSNTSGFETTGETRSGMIEPDNLLPKFDPAVFGSVPWSDYFEPGGGGKFGYPLIASLDYDEFPLPAPEMILDSPQPTVDSEYRPEGSGEDSVSLRCRSNSEQITQSSLSVIYTNGCGGLSTHDGVAKSTHGRHGPLSLENASRIAKTRKEKTVCISCRIRKVACNGGSPCKRCVLISKTKLLEQPCLKAHFTEIVCGGSCNYFSQRQINHLTLDGARRVSKTLPEELEFHKLLSLTGQRQQNFNIGASQDFRGTLLWTLDLSQLYKFLLKLQKRFKIPDRTGFRAFLDNVLPLASHWESCVKDLEEDEDLLAVLHRWNTMPSYVSFSLVPLAPHSALLPLDIEDPAQEDDVVLAAQLSRIICRALETGAFDALQKCLNKPSTYHSPPRLHKLCFEIGQVLLQFRWRIAWWNLSGDGGSNDTQSKQRYIARLKQLTLVLYFYYCAARAKLPSYGVTGDLKGIQRFKDGKATFFEYFPDENSIKGWELWMELGTTLVAEARRERAVERQDPYPKIELRSTAVSH